MYTQLRLTFAHLILILSLILTHNWVRSDVFALVDMAAVAILVINLLVLWLNEYYQKLQLNKMQYILLGLVLVFLLFSVESTDSCLIPSAYHPRFAWMEYFVQSNQIGELMFGFGLISWLLFVIVAVYIWLTKFSVSLLMLAKR